MFGPFFVKNLIDAILVVSMMEPFVMRIRNISVRFSFQLFILLLFSFPFGCTERGKETVDNTEQKNLDPTVFKKIESSSSNLHFSNTIKEDIATRDNLFDYDYFYNGAGVGLVDINNDGLLDVFFVGNQVANKLFLNKGDLTFEDISMSANINNNKQWGNGITVVDINNDGWMDIYISQGGPNTRENRKNLLFINQKDNTFTEEAENYGLADMGISTQSVFFDFDKDGDLDCFIMNENELYGVDPINLYRIVKRDAETTYYNTSHFYENQNGKFKDITKASGIERPIFGLGLSVADINDDGWLDFYVASDYYIPDALFINNKNGTFTDQIKDFTKQISFFGMGMDVADINNDGLQDIFVLDMATNDHIRSKTLMASMDTKRFDYLVNKAGFHYQYMYNSLQLNNGGGSFSNIAQSTEMANTDWSWSVLLSDFDNDEDKDVYVTNGYRRYALDNDLQLDVFKAKMKYKNKVPLSVKKRLYEEMPSEKTANVLFENKGNLQFKENGKNWGLANFSFSNGAAVGDLDNDGDLDIVVNNMDENCFLYKNTSREKDLGNYLNVKATGTLSESYPKITIYYNGKTQFIESRRVRGYRSSQDPIAHFGVAGHKTIDSVTVSWLSGKTETKYDIPSNTTLSFEEQNALTNKNTPTTKAKTLFASTPFTATGLDFKHQENTYDDFEKEVLLPYKQSNLGPFMAKGDINNDGLEDLYIGGASGQAGALFKQLPNGTFIKRTSKTFLADKYSEDMEASFFDVDGDHDLDLFVVSGGNEFAEYSSYYADRLYINDGKGNFKKKEVAALKQYPKSGKTVIAMDFDKDGDQDIIVGNRIRPQNYPLPTNSTIYQNNNGELLDVTDTVAPGLQNFGVINDLVVTDFNKDGWQDFIAVGEWTGIGIFQNNGGNFNLLPTEDTVLADKGWWFSINETDINKDGLPDYIVGNAGLNIKFKASKKKPFKIFANDFDDNGTPDIVLSKEYNGTYVPVRGRECSSQQMPFIKQKFTSYSEFANAKLVDIYGDKLNSSYENEVTEFKSVLLVNKGNGTFEKRYLPTLAQLSPILSTQFKDLNNDGFEDVVLAGNIYEMEVETPRLDALSGLVLLSNGKNGYTVLPRHKTGLYLEGNIKDIKWVQTKNGDILVSSSNNGPLSSHSLQE